MAKNRKFKMAAISGEGKIFFKSPRLHSLDTLYLARLRRYKQFCVFPFSAKIRKFKMATIFGERKIFCKLTIVHSLDTLWVENFDKITISHG